MKGVHTIYSSIIEELKNTNDLHEGDSKMVKEKLTELLDKYDISIDQFSKWYRKTHPIPRVEVDSTIYFLSCPNGMIKIGMTTQNVKARLSQIQPYSPVKLSVLATMKGARIDELALHKRFSHCHSHNEWFNPHPNLLEYIEVLNERKTS